VRQMRQVGHALHGADDHVAAVAAVAPVRPAPGRILLATEAQAAVAAGASLNVDIYFVYKH